MVDTLVVLWHFRNEQSPHSMQSIGKESSESIICRTTGK